MKALVHLSLAVITRPNIPLQAMGTVLTSATTILTTLVSLTVQS